MDNKYIRVSLTTDLVLVMCTLADTLSRIDWL